MASPRTTWQLGARTGRHPLLLAVAGCVLAFMTLTHSLGHAQKKKLDAASAAMDRGLYDEAETILAPLANQKFNYEAKILDARLKMLTGDYDEAELQVKRALARARTDGQTATAVMIRGDIEALRGRYDDAIRSFTRVVEEFPDFKSARVRLGDVLMTVGKKEEAQKILDTLADDYNDGKMKSAAELTLVGKSVWWLEYFEDANSVLNDAVDVDKTYIPAWIAWGSLFLEKYNTEDATYAFSQALKVNPRHPEALLGMARVQLAESNNYNEASTLVDKALEVNPRMPEAFVLRAQLQIDEEDYDGALRTLDKALSVNPNHLDALIMEATCHYLKDDKRLFERVRRKVFRINPKAARFYTTIAQFGVRVHRYEEAIDLNLKALKVDPDYWRAFVALGIGYTRIGDDDKGFDYLKKAFENDPFNVRAFNMVNLYEETMPEYVFVKDPPLRFRFHRSERPVLSRVVPPLLQEAYGELRALYRFTPKAPVSIEIFRKAETFSVRSVGLPHISPHGICFGRVVTARSPNSGDFNWAEVLWHELAHVFHIQMSRSRVPRWFTEGLAEYEAGRARTEWRREQDMEIVAAMVDGSLLSVRDLNRGFTQARTFRQIVTAYFQSTLVIEFIINQAGFDAILRALKLYGRSKTTPEVLEAVTGLEPAAFDRAFRSYLEQRYNVLLNSFEPQLPLYDDLEKFTKEARSKPSDAGAQANYAMALFRSRRIDQAEAAYKRALKLDGDQPLANFLASVFAMRTRRVDDARDHLERVVKKGHDGHSVQYQLGLIAQADGRVDDAIAHYEKAAAFYPRAPEPYRALTEIHIKSGDTIAASDALEHVTDIDQNDVRAALRLMKIRLELEDYKGALLAGNRASHIQPFDASIHVSVGKIALEVGEHERARYAFEAALAIGPEGGDAGRAEVLAGLARAHYRLGDKRAARKTLKRAESASEAHPAILKLKKDIPKL